LRLEYGLADEPSEPSEPQLAVRHLEAKVAKKEEAFRVAIAEISTLQVPLDTERQSYTSSPIVERELVRLQHSYGQLREIARDLGIDATRLLRTHSSDDLILLTSIEVLCRVVLDRLGHV